METYVSMSFAIRADWLHRDSPDPIERVSLAAVTIVARGACLTRILDSRANTVRPTANLSAYQLALWLASNWWRLLHEPFRDTLDWKLSHELPAIAGGYVWPPLSIESSGEETLIVAAGHERAAWEPISYLTTGKFAFRTDEFAGGVESFIAGVIDRLHAYRLPKSDLERAWQEIVDARLDHEIARRRRLEAIVGCDPNDAPDHVLAGLEALAARTGQSSVEELAAEFALAAVSETERALVQVEQSGAPWAPTGAGQYAEQSLHESPLPASVVGASGDSVELLVSAPWREAAQVARECRREWRMGSGPISHRKLAEFAGVDLSVLSSGKKNLTQRIAVATIGDPLHGKILLRARMATGRRFELARLLGDAMRFGNGNPLLVATNGRTERQRFQRAFAQELLFPWEAMSRRFTSERIEPEEIESAARDYKVSPLLVRTTLVNRGRLDRSALLDA